MSRAIEAILRRCGFDVIATVASPAAALMTADLSRLDVAVVDLALAGDLGLGMIEALRTAQPRCAVVVLSPFEELRGPAMAAGAFDVVSDAWSDLRALEQCLRRAAAELAVPEPAVEEAGDDAAAGAVAGAQEPLAAETPPGAATAAGKRSTKAPSS